MIKMKVPRNSAAISRTRGDASSPTGSDFVGDAADGDATGPPELVTISEILRHEVFLLQLLVTKPGRNPSFCCGFLKGMAICRVLSCSPNLDLAQLRAAVLKTAD